jgi:hypothetical protein
LPETGSALGDAGRSAEAGEALGDAGRSAEAGRVAGAEHGAHAASDATETNPVQITLRGVEHTLPDWHMQAISYTKRTDAAREALRSAFPAVRRAFVKGLAANHVAELRQAGLSQDEIGRLARGLIPRGYEVHHLLPLDDGGTNAMDNLVLIKANPDHMMISMYQNAATKGMSAGETKRLMWPTPDHPVDVWPKTPDGGAAPTRH